MVGKNQRVNAPLIPANEPSRLNSEPHKPQLTVARKTSRVTTFERKSNDVTLLDYRDGDLILKSDKDGEEIIAI